MIGQSCLHRWRRLLPSWSSFRQCAVRTDKIVRREVQRHRLPVTHLHSSRRKKDSMAMYFFQLSENEYPIASYRLHVWETERWRFFARRMIRVEKSPEPGDTVVFFYAPSRADEAIDSGFVGWAVVLQWIPSPEPREERELCFRAASPSDFLKMHPWNDTAAIDIANQVRGPMKEATLWPIEESVARKLTRGIATWVAGRSTQD
jgi:hypothetical protein